MRRLAAAATLALFLVPSPAEPCTTFLVSRGDELAVGKSYDWHQGQGLAFVNKRGVAKQSLPLRREDPPAKWVSRHASLTFNQYGRELPNGGMNDAGLVVEVMWLDSSRYPPADARPAINELQWIQYQLDNFATVKELVAAADETRISQAYAKVHYLACDRAGDCAALELVDGELVVTHGEALAAKTLTNNTYAQSVAHLRKHQGFGGKLPIPKGPGSLERFVRASALAAAPGAAPLRTEAFRILSSVYVQGRSQWNIVYEPARLTAHFRMGATGKIKSIDLSRFDGSCATSAKFLDLSADLAGDVSERLADYRPAANRRLVERSLSGIKHQLPAGIVDSLAKFPELLPCQAR